MASKTVLVIDADNETEQVIASTLESEGYLVFAVPGGDVGAEMAQKVKPSLIFVSPEDTSEKGMKVCRTIRSYESLKNVPIILLTSRPVGADLASYGVVDSVLLPVSTSGLLEKTERAIDAKAPVVLRVKEKAAALREDAGPEGEPSFKAPKDAGPAKSRLSDFSEIAGMEEEPEEFQAAPRKDWEEDVAYVPEGEGGGRKSRKLLVALLVIMVVVAGAAVALYFSGLIPGLEPGAKMAAPPLQTVQKPKAPEPAPPAELPSASPAPSAGEGKNAVPPAPAAPAGRAVEAKKSSGKAVYSVQVGAFQSEKNAAALEKKMIEKGYDAFTLKSGTQAKGAVIYKVLVGRFDDRRKSREMAAKISKKEKIKGVIFSE
jgi:CheY-like chemotaxis protein